MKVVLGMVMAAALMAPALAGPGLMPPSAAGSPAMQVRDGCGPGYFRNMYGHCRPEEWERERHYERLECPRGYHLIEGGRRCWPN